MPEAGGVDTSSYNLPTQPGFLDVASKLGGLKQQSQAIQSNDISIAQQQLGLIKDRFKVVSGQIPGLLSKPDLNESDIQQFYQNNVKSGFMSPDMAATEIAKIPPTQGMPADKAALTLKNHMGNELQKAMTTMEALEYHLGKGGSVDTGASNNPTLSSPKPGFAGNPKAGGVIQPQPGIPTQPGPTTPIVSQGGPGQAPRGTPSIIGPSAPRTGLPTAPGALPVGPAPVPPGMKLNGGRVTGIDVGPDQPNLGAPNAPKQIVTGNPPLFEAGKTQFAQDQQIASAKSQAMIPALQALPLMKDIMSGPGTAGFTHAIAGLKAFGILSTDTNDPIVARQEIAKKLNAYILSNPVGQRSDAQQTLAEASSPSPNVQLLPALIKLTKDAIAQDRTTISKPGAFNNDDFSKYGSHTTNYPTDIDQKAMQLDTMEPKERQSLLDDMKKKKDTAQGKKFWNTLSIVKKQGLFNISNGQ